MKHPDPSQTREIERFTLLLDQVRNAIAELKRENRRLKSENEKLRNELEVLESDRNNDAFSSLDDMERIELRQQIDGLIAKIDHHLNG